MLANPNGSAHESATRVYEANSQLNSVEEVESKDLTLAALTPTTPGGVLSSEEMSLGSDELMDSLTALELSLNQDQTIQLLSLPCLMVVLAHSVPGTLVFTKRSLTFTADDSSDEYKKASYLVG